MVVRYKKTALTGKSYVWFIRSSIGLDWLSKFHRLHPEDRFDFFLILLVKFGESLLSHRNIDTMLSPQLFFGFFWVLMRVFAPLWFFRYTIAGNLVVHIVTLLELN